MLRSNLCDYADAYILVKGTITITGAGDDDAAKRLDERNKGVIFKNCAPFTKCISRINNTEIDNAKDIDIVMPMYNLIEYSDNYSKTFGSLTNGNTKYVEMIGPFKYLSNFWRTLEMPLINCEVNLELTW